MALDKMEIQEIAINALVDVAKSGKSESQRVAAARVLLIHATTPSPDSKDIPEITDEERARALSVFLARTGLFLSDMRPDVTTLSDAELERIASSGLPGESSSSAAGSAKQ